jgi:hypothetical protein
MIRHGGVDLMYPRIAGDKCLPGTPNGSRGFIMPDHRAALAASDGVASFAQNTPRGWTVIVDHIPRKLSTYYTHLSQLLVVPKQPVFAGQPIGIIGSDPLDAEHLLHLHFELWRGGPKDGVDPAPLMIAKTITVKQQTCYGITTTPKGRTRRTIPMTSTLEQALRRLEVVREGFVVRNLDGSQKSDGQANAVIVRICRRAGLPLKRWHTPSHVRNPCGAVRGEPLAAAGMDGPQADRRDDDLRPCRRGSSPGHPGTGARRSRRRGGSGSPNPPHARQSWQ